MKVLNLYAGIGGNRKLWDEVVDGLEVTAVEIEPQIAEVYQDSFPNDEVAIEDAHKYLKEHYERFDFIWSSPPCKTHSMLEKISVNSDTYQTKNRTPRYPDMDLYQEIIFLKHFFEGKWVVENVSPYYSPLIEAQKVDRHLFWSNFNIPEKKIEKDFDFSSPGSNTEEKLEEWLGINLEESIYIGDSHDPAQILRNCVHPQLGKHILESAYSKKVEKLEAFY